MRCVTVVVDVRTGLGHASPHRNFGSVRQKRATKLSLFYIKAVKNLQNTTNTKTLQNDSAESMERHCNHAIATYISTNIYKYKRYKQKK